jgi:predicted PurR-regulated permease PerM
MINNNYYKYFIFAGGVLIVGVAAWYFKSIIAYVLISAVLSLIGAPVVNFLDKIKIGKFSLPKAFCAGITLVLFWAVFITFFRLFVPLIAMEAQKLSSIDINKVVVAMNEPIKQIDAVVNQLNVSGGESFSTVNFLTQKVQSVLSIGLFTDFFSSLASTIGNIFIALFSVSFITFFFLKDERLFGGGVILLVPTRYEMPAQRVLISTKNLLMRYFVGIGAQITGIMILVSIGFYIVGIDFRTCLVVALFAGIINVIPYIGPLIGSIFGIIVGLASKMLLLVPDQIMPLVFSILVVFLIVHLVDNIVFQPFIYSNSIKAHPLEVFLVLLIAGHLAGITGMLVAIPGYTVIRVFAKQFLNNFKVVKKLTEKI